MSQKSFADDDLDVESQQANLPVSTGKNPRRRWHSAYSVLKALRMLVSTANDTGMETQVELINVKLHPEWSQKSSVNDLDKESQQVIVLVDTSKTPRRRWHLVYLVLKALRMLVSTANDTVMEAQLDLMNVKLHSEMSQKSFVNDLDIKSQQAIFLINTGKTPRRRWQLVYLVLKALRILVSITNDAVTETQPESTAFSGTGLPELTREEIAKMIREKDLTTLREYGGVQWIAQVLNSDTENGIPAHEENLHHQRMTIHKPKLEAHDRTFIHFLRKSCKSSTIFLLLILDILSFAIRIKEAGLSTGWYEGAVILSAVILIVVVQSICESRNESSRQLSTNQLWQNQEPKVQVLRGGCPQTICISDVLLGDIVLLEKGDQVPADGLLIPTESLEVNDKADPIINDQNPFLFYGSKVTDGSGKMLVTSVGAKTKLGNMLSIAQLSKRTPVEEQLSKLSTSTQKMGIVISIIIIVVSFLRFKLEKEYDNSGLPDFSGKSHTLKGLYEAITRVGLRPQGMLTMLTSSFTLLLVGIAEGLPLAITIAVICWNKRMLGDKTCAIMFAQGPSVTVTMASVTIICTNKTGGLALIPQEVERCCIGGKDISEDSKISIHVLEAIWDGIGISSLIPENSRTSVDDSILSWAAEKWGLKMEIWKQRNSIIEFKQPTENENIVAALIGKDRGNGPTFLHCKGPATTILDRCSQFYDIEGIIRFINTSKRMDFEGIIEQMQSKDFESVAFACKQVDDSGFDERNLVMLGLLGLKKTSGHDTRTVIENFREAGIKVLLVSSEEVSILQDIATAFGVIQPDADALAITGERFQSISDKDRIDMAARISVMGNSLPSDQLLLLSCLKDQGHTVAVVGNRTNDIPMLKAADVGLTLETWSTDIARKSTDIIIKEGNLTSILAIIKCGRCIHNNIRKYIQFQLTMTLAAGLVPLITNASDGSSPITTIQFHWAISVLTPLGGLALLMELPGDMLMKEFTPGADKRLITKALWANIIIQTAYQTSLLATIQSKGPTMLGLSKKVTETMIFNSFFLCQVFNIFNAREPEKRNIFRGVHGSKWFWVGTLTALLLQVAFLEMAHIIAGDRRLTYAEWGMCLLLGMISWCIDLSGKCILLMIKKWMTKPPGSVVRGNRNLSSAAPEPACNLELPQVTEKQDKVD